MNKTNYSNVLRCFAYAGVICVSSLQTIRAQDLQPDAAAIRKATVLNVIRNLEHKHVRPKAIDDNFSKIIWKKYLENLDPNKEILLQSDLQQLRRYELSIDNELKEGQTAFFTAAYQIYQQRLNAAAATYKRILESPFDFKKDESIQLSGELRNFADSQAALTRLLQKKAKYLVLKKMSDLSNGKTNSPALEKEARIKVDKWVSNTFKNLTGQSALNERFSQYINTITLEVDPHTSYFPPVKARSVNDQMAKRFYGLGLELQDKEGDVFIKALRPGGVAIKSGLIDVNDRILSISDAKGTMLDVAGISITDISDMIRGEKDTEVSLGLLKSSGLEKTVALKRSEIKDEEGRARSAIIEKNGYKIGYIYLQEFYVDMVNPAGIRSADDVQRELIKLKAENVNGIIFDLRNNGGGSLDEVVKMSGYFLGKGPKVQIKDANELKIHTTNAAPLYEGPLVVLVNEQSASASEIFAAVIQDYKRGIIIGSPSTYGKGTAQATLPMGKMGDKAKGTPNISYGSLRLTQHQFYRVNGASTQLRGVKADVILPGKLAYLKIREKDNATALAWDSIQPAIYTEFNKATVWNKILHLAKESVGQDEKFSIVDENSKLLMQNQLNPVSLNLDKFSKEQARLSAFIRNIDQAILLPEFKKNKVKGTLDQSVDPGNEWYKKWTEGISADIYLDKSLEIINKIITVK
ncbi:carboxy terminal-processing peptidase [Pedobacter nyackensis]|uniref:Carboxyl-terminal processing protease n=1 Tax=Pedobacter nyackensis TaxID=475255 RepID=A0A1W2ABC6_9SPHI|nr:carboxy terminal-processing peptidase [Pedobacter nyackensis]SMC57944.1 carboxyl-terminal processing protease [Pedobacter nyackensis]